MALKARYNGKHPGGRPPKVDVKKVAADLIEYTKNAKPYPILAEFALTLDITREHLYLLARENPVLHDAIAHCHAAKEVGLERTICSGLCPPAFGIFSLKQLGWTDKQEVAHTGIPAEVPALLQIEIVRNSPGIQQLTDESANAAD